MIQAFEVSGSGMTLPTDIEDGDTLRYSEADNAMVKNTYKTWRVISEHNLRKNLKKNNEVVIITGHNLSNVTNGKIIFGFLDTNSSPYNEASIDIKEFKSKGRAYSWNWDKWWIDLYLINEVNGKIKFVAREHDTIYVNSRVEVQKF